MSGFSVHEPAGQEPLEVPHLLHLVTQFRDLGHHRLVPVLDNHPAAGCLGPAAADEQPDHGREAQGAGGGQPAGGGKAANRSQAVPRFRSQTGEPASRSIADAAGLTSLELAIALDAGSATVDLRRSSSTRCSAPRNCEPTTVPSDVPARCSEDSPSRRHSRAGSPHPPRDPPSRLPVELRRSPGRVH